MKKETNSVKNKKSDTFYVEIAYEVLQKIGIEEEEDLLMLLMDNELIIRCKPKKNNSLINELPTGWKQLSL